MLKSISLTLLALLSKTKASITFTCPPAVPCEIDGNSSLTVLAPKTVPVLIINCKDCKKNGQLPGLTVYSSANRTRINCLKDDACEETTLNFGISPDAASNALYDCPRKSVVVECVKKQSCKNIRINTEGIISQGLRVNTSTVVDNTGSFMQGLINCGSTNLCEINCGLNNVQDTCKDANCFGTGCVCLPQNNEASRCPANFNVPPTPEPTTSPLVAKQVIPTQRPTPEPTNRRNSTACDVNGCIIAPGNDFDVNCGAQFTECNVQCLEENQCQNGVIIQANSAIVNIECTSENSCDKLKVISVKGNIVNIALNGETSGENMVIVAENPNARVNIIAGGQESFTNGRLFCDADCDLVCTGDQACENTLYECLNTKDKCTCSGGSCPLIRFFGDQSCAGLSECTVVPTGSDRVIALNNVDVLTVDCTVNPQQCKQQDNGLRIFSAAKKTIIKCQKIDACEGISVRVGNLKGRRVPKGFKASEFVVTLSALTNEKQTLEMNCDAEDSCKEADVYVTGSVNAKILGDGENALQEVRLDCDDCESLKFECLDFYGCPGAEVFCPPVDALENNRCECLPVYMFVNLTTTATESPRNTCPSIDERRVKQNSIAAVTNTKNDSLLSNNMKLIIGLVIGGTMVVLLFGVIMMKCRKYETIKDGKYDEFILKQIQNNNEHFQVEMS